jgi:hypothetical protein
MIGYDAALFLEPPPEYVTCSVCLGVLNDPHSCLQGHRRARATKTPCACASKPARAAS